MIFNTTLGKFLYSTIFISGSTRDNIEFYGTGTFFSYQVDASTIRQFTLTNKHVMDNCKEVKFYFHEGSDNKNKEISLAGNSFWFSLSNFEKFWTPHFDKNVDLDAFDLNTIKIHVLQNLGKSIYHVNLDKIYIKSDKELEVEADVGQNILMYGYPDCFFDEKNNLPIVRKGITSSHPAIDFDDKSEGIVDIASFEGSSGSPVFINEAPVYLDKDDNIKCGRKFIFLGILAKGPHFLHEGEIPNTNLVSYTEQMMHLGYYVKAKEILNLCEYMITSPRAA